MTNLNILYFAFSKFFIIFGGSYLIFKFFFKSFAEKRRIQEKPRPSASLGTELKYSIAAVMILALMLMLLKLGVDKGLFQITDGWSSRSGAEYLMSFIGYFLIYDTYFFFSHWLLHQKFLYVRFHRIHHLCLSPNPFSSYTFHPVETIINFLYIYLVALVLPLNWPMLCVLLILTDFGNLAGHLGFEFMPRGTVDQGLGAWMTTPTHHNLHHQAPNYNFGLYFRGWDKIFNKLHPKTDDLFREITERT